MYKDHPAFEPIPDGSAIWRYFSLAKFVSLLQKQALYFARADTLGDPYEGSSTKTLVQAREGLFAQDSDELRKKRLAYLSMTMKELRKLMMISSWHINDGESAAMWRLYVQGNEGIAIRTTFERLKQSFINEKQNIYIGKVKYIDYDNEWFPADNLFYAVMNKRKSFMHEQELRAIVSISSPGRKDEFVIESLSSVANGTYIATDINQLIDSVYVVPTAEKWFLEVVESLVTKFGLKVPVAHSSLTRDPLF